MSFPRSYKGKIELYERKIKGEKINLPDLQSIIQQSISDTHIINEEKEAISFKMLNQIFRYSFFIQIDCKEKGNDIDINYEIDNEKLIQIILTVVVFLAFLSILSIKYFLIISGIFSIVFYQLNILMNTYSVERLIKEAIGNNRYEFTSSEILSAEQIEWIKDKNRCSACGQYLEVTDVICPECGIRIKKGKKYNPVNLSKYNDRSVNWHFKQKD